MTIAAMLQDCPIASIQLQLPFFLEACHIRGGVDVVVTGDHARTHSTARCIVDICNDILSILSV